MGASNPDALGAKIQQVYPTDNFRVGVGQWFVVDAGTAKDVSDKLGVTPLTPASTVGTAVVVTTAGYYGRYAANLWEWMKAKLEQPANG